jgi:transmembrane sensor
MRQPRQMATGTSGIDATTETAIDWIIKLTSGHTSATDRASFDQWLAADTRHLVAWQEVSTLLKQPVTAIQQADLLTPGQRQAARLALTATPPSTTRRKMLGSSITMLALGIGAYT